MKKVRIFLSVSILILLGISIAASNATSKFATYYYQETNNVCSVIEACSSGGECDCTVTIGVKTYMVFTRRSLNGQICSVIAKRPC